LHGSCWHCGLLQLQLLHLHRLLLQLLLRRLLLLQGLHRLQLLQLLHDHWLLLLLHDPGLLLHQCLLRLLLLLHAKLLLPKQPCLLQHAWLCLQDSRPQTGSSGKHNATLLGHCCCCCCQLTLNYLLLALNHRHLHCKTLLLTSCLLHGHLLLLGLQSRDTGHTHACHAATCLHEALLLRLHSHCSLLTKRERRLHLLALQHLTRHVHLHAILLLLLLLLLLLGPLGLLHQPRIPEIVRLHCFGKL
jgi:hypothetical protein